MARPRKKRTQRQQVSYEKGTRHWVQQQTGLPCLAEIVDVRGLDSGSESSSQSSYYVHYINFDKRLDEWIGPERFLTAGQTRELGEEYFEADPALASGTARTLTRNLRRRFSDSFAVSPPVNSIESGNNNSSNTRDTPVLDPLTRQLEQEHEEATRVKNINKITLGCWEIDCWYFSPFPEEYSQASELFFCERCLKYMRYPMTLARHGVTCQYAGPPGRLIYLHDGLAVYEADGATPGHKLYCQNLCLLAKLFLDHKTIYYDVSPFLFYILCEVDTENHGDDGDGDDEEVLTNRHQSTMDRQRDLPSVIHQHPVGFFSKEKQSADGYNLACIMILPPYQRHGYGRFLMALSYELSRREGKSGTPERPLSDLGLIGYRRFWGRQVLLALGPGSTVDGLARSLGFTTDDVTDTLNMLGMLKAAAGGGREGRSPSVLYNARLVKDLLATKYTLRPGAAELEPGALDWSPRSSGIGLVDKPAVAVAGGTKRTRRTRKY